MTKNKKELPKSAEGPIEPVEALKAVAPRPPDVKNFPVTAGEFCALHNIPKAHGVMLKAYFLRHPDKKYQAKRSHEEWQQILDEELYRPVMSGK